MERYFELIAATVAHAQNLVCKARAAVSTSWRVFDGYLDLKTPSGRHKGSTDGVADKCMVGFMYMQSLALVELKLRSSPADVPALCSQLDIKWSKYHIPRLKAPWTHGLLVVLRPISAVRSLSGRDSCQVTLWSMGSLPCVPIPQRHVPPSPSPKPAAKAKPKAMSRPVSHADKWALLLRRLRGQGDVAPGEWIVLKAFLRKVGLNAAQTKRHVEGKYAWTIGEGRGRSLVLSSDWCFMKSKRGGGQGQGVPHVKANALRQVFLKCYYNKQIAD